MEVRKVYRQAYKDRAFQSTLKTGKCKKLNLLYFRFVSSEMSQE
jgi:hypothetical protein